MTTLHLTAGERDWPEDAKDTDNGRYQNICCLCGKEFIGHKRRVACKVCSTAGEQEWTADHTFLFSPTGEQWRTPYRLQIRDAINAALTAEREQTLKAQQAAIGEGIRAGEFERQLAAEREQVTTLRELREFDAQTIQQLHSQLDAAPEWTPEYVKKLARGWKAEGDGYRIVSEKHNATLAAAVRDAILNDVGTEGSEYIVRLEQQLATANHEITLLKREITNPRD
jgi:hypothetical protein